MKAALTLAVVVLAVVVADYARSDFEVATATSFGTRQTVYITIPEVYDTRDYTHNGEEGETFYITHVMNNWTVKIKHPVEFGNNLSNDTLLDQPPGIARLKVPIPWQTVIGINARYGAVLAGYYSDTPPVIESAVHVP